MISKFKKKVSLLETYKDSIFYKIDCDCADSNCETIIELEIDTKLKILSLNFYKTINLYSFTNYENWIVRISENIFNRFKYAFKILFTGKISMSSDFILRDLEHINNFIEAIQEGKEYLTHNNSE
jgi:hypothetical protein